MKHYMLGHNETFYCGPGFMIHCAAALLAIMYLDSSNEILMLQHQYLVFCILYLQMCSGIDVEFN
jgi:hypothetical protein